MAKKAQFFVYFAHIFSLQLPPKIFACPPLCPLPNFDASATTANAHVHVCIQFLLMRRYILRQKMLT